jgi:hypothetical protein
MAAITKAQTSKRDGQVTEESRHNLGVDDLAGIWAKVTPRPKRRASELARDELRAMREERRGEDGHESAPWGAGSRQDATEMRPLGSGVRTWR